MTMTVWQGPSQIGFHTRDDEGNITGWVEPGTPLVVLATITSSNEKTGDMVQLYILRADMAPTEAARAGLDGAICGECIHRSKPAGGLGSCYVVKFFADQPWRVWAEGNAEPFQLRRFKHRAIRFGAYGDPAAVPAHVWRQLRAVALPGHWTGYTHQWRTAPAEFAEFCMASVESDEERHAAEALGYRCYQVYGAGEPKPAGTVRCPWSEDRPGGPQQIQCRDCLKCSGTGAGRRGHVSIMAHGNTGQRFKSLPLMVATA